LGQATAGRPGGLPYSARSALQPSQARSGRFCPGLDGILIAMEHVYYSQRIGRGPIANPTINDLARALTLTLDEMWRREYLQEWHSGLCDFEKLLIVGLAACNTDRKDLLASGKMMTSGPLWSGD
jgi:hypothetical protein